MTMIITIQKTLEIDIDSEIERAKRVYNKAELKRLMPILKLFKERKFKECFDLAEKLPHNGSYSEKEHLPLFFGEFVRELQITEYLQKYNKFNNMVISKVKVLKGKT